MEDQFPSSQFQPLASLNAMMAGQLSNQPHHHHYSINSQLNPLASQYSTMFSPSPTGAAASKWMGISTYYARTGS